MKTFIILSTCLIYTSATGNEYFQQLPDSVDAICETNRYVLPIPEKWELIGKIDDSTKQISMEIVSVSIENDMIAPLKHADMLITMQWPLPCVRIDMKLHNKGLPIFISHNGFRVFYEYGGEKFYTGNLNDGNGGLNLHSAILVLEDPVLSQYSVTNASICFIPKPIIDDFNLRKDYKSVLLEILSSMILEYVIHKEDPKIIFSTDFSSWNNIEVRKIEKEE